MNRAVIIDNDGSQRRSLKGILINEGFEVEEAVDGQRGISIAREKDDVVVIFIADKLIGLSGMDTLIAIRKFRPKVPVLMLMSGKDRKSGQLALSRGAAWFLHKPILVEDVLVVLRHLMETQRLQQTIDHQVERLQLLEQQTSELTQIDVDFLPTEEIIRNSEFLSKSIDIIASVLEAKKVSMMLLSQDGKDLVMGKSNWILPSKVPNIRQPITNGVAGQVAREGKSILIKDVTKDPDTQINEYTRQYESPSFMAAPVRLGGKVIGVITVNDRKDKVPFTENDLVMLNTFCHQMSMSIANMCMMKRTEREKLKLQFINDIVQDLLSSVDPGEIYTTLIEKIMNGLRATAGMLAFSDPKGNQILIEHVEPEDRIRKPGYPIPVGNGIIAEVFKTGQVVFENQTSEDSRADKGSDFPPGLEAKTIAAAPIKSNGKILGVIAFYNKEEGLPFDSWDMEILHSVSPQASMAIKQAWLYQNLIKSIDDVVDTNRQLEDANREIKTKIRELERLKTKVSS
jgi:GAF domain-containing protein